MNERKLNFAEAPVQVLTLEELEKSYHENLPTGDPVGGIYHFALIQQVLAMFEERGLKPVVQEVFAAANRDSKRPGVTLLPQLEEKYGERAVEAHLLRRVYANIEIRSDETEDVVTCLAVAYHQKGIQLGIGPMVKVCHNQTILGAQDVVSNYTCFGGQNRKDKLSLDDVLVRAQQWADDYEPYQKIRAERIGAMKSAQMDREGMLKPNRMDIPQVLPQSLALFETLYETIKK